MFRKTGSLCILLALILLVCTGCSAVASLPEGFDQTEVEKKAEEVILLLNDGKYDDVCALCREDLQATLTGDALESALSASFEKLGAYEEITKYVTGGTKDKTTAEEYAVTMVTAKYNKGKALFTLSFNKNLEIVGIYMK